VNAERLGGAGLVSVVALQDSLDETFLEFTDRFFEEDAALHHLGYQAVQLISHVRTLRCRSNFPEGARQLIQLVPDQNPVRFAVFGASSVDNIGGQLRSGRSLGPADAL